MLSPDSLQMSWFKGLFGSNKDAPDEKEGKDKDGKLPGGGRRDSVSRPSDKQRVKQPLREFEFQSKALSALFDQYSSDSKVTVFSVATVCVL